MGIDKEYRSFLVEISIKKIKKVRDMSEVKWFHMKLKELLVNNQMTIKELCDKSDMNYMSTLKVMKGERVLKKVCFNKILDSGCFSQDEVDQLKRSYQYVNISKDDRDKIESVICILKNIYETVVEKSTYDRINQKLLGSYNYMINMCNKISDHIYKSYTNALKAVYANEKGRFDLILFLPDMPVLNNEVFHTLEAMISCLDKRVEWKFKCMVLRSKEEVDSKSFHMASLCKYIKLATLSKNIEINILEQEEKSKINYGVYFNDRTLFLNKQGNDFILEYKDHRNRFNSLNYKFNDLFKVFYNREGFNAYLKNLIESDDYIKNNHYGIRSYLSAVSMGRTFLKNNTDIFKSDYKLFQDYSHETLKLYLKKEKSIFENKDSVMSQCVCESGIENLLKDGIVPDYSLMGEVLDHKERLSLIYDALKKIKLGYELRLLPLDIKDKHPYLGVINFFELHQKNKQWMLARSKPSNECLKKDGFKNSDLMYGIVIEDPSLVESFELFCKHVIPYKSMDSKASVNKIQSLVSKYYDHDTDEAVKALTQKIKTFEL